MAEVAAHLVDHVFPGAPVRQWVLSVPHRVRFLLARSPKLCREVRGVFARAVHSFYSRRAKAQGHAAGRCGSVVQVQRFDSALRLDLHLHGLFLDGVYTGFAPGEPLVFHSATPLTEDDISWMVRHIHALVTGHLRRRGHLDDDGTFVTQEDDEGDELRIHQAAAIQGKIPFGLRAGQQATLFDDPLHVPTQHHRKKLCADHEGYSLHAAIRLAAGRTERLERLCRYVTRPPFAQDRLAVTRDGSIVYRFRRPWRNGKQAVVLDPMTFLSRLAAQVPPPRFHMLSYYGVLAPAASRREDIVPGYDADDHSTCATQQRGVASGRSEKASKPRPRMLWAELIRRVFLEDVLQCPCGGRRRVLAMVFDPAAIEQILRHLDLPHVAPARSPPRSVQAALPFEG